jgi:hypothetical protein
MDIKEVINNVLHKHNKLKIDHKNDSDNDLNQDYIKKEDDPQNEEKLYQDFEDNFHHIVDDLPPDYWRKHFQKKSPKNIKTNSKKGKFYLYYGMRINLKKPSEEAKQIIELMHIIRKSHTKNDIFDKMADIKIQENKIKNNQQNSLISIIKSSSKSTLNSSSDDDGGSSNQELEKEVTQEKNPEINNIHEHLRLEELYIQSVAVSLLAESDGNSAIAKKILHNGGMEAIKKMDVNSLKVVLDQLNQIIPNEHEIC